MTTTRPPAQSPTETKVPGLVARVSLGRLLKPVPIEFVLIAAVAVFLTGFGFVMVLSATSAPGPAGSPFEVALKQAVFAIVGIPLMLVLSRFSLKAWQRLAWPMLIVAIAMQLLVFTPLGMEADGNRNWLNFQVIQVQPSEFLKVTLAIWIGFILARKQALLGRFRHLAIPLLPVIALVLTTVLAGDDMGTALIIALVAAAAVFFAGVRLRALAIPLLLAAAGAAALVMSSENRVRRFTAFLDPNCPPDVGVCFQSVHGTWALANGGLFGLGLGGSVEKYGWLPAQGNDFIFAIIGEELGLIGCAVVLALFGTLAWAGLSIARRTDQLFVRIVAGAVTVWIVGQALVNISVVLRLAPALGVPLPFLSQGGTALLSVLVACGVLLSMARTLPPAGTVTHRPSVGGVRTPVQQLD